MEVLAGSLRSLLDSRSLQHRPLYLSSGLPLGNQRLFPHLYRHLFQPALKGFSALPSLAFFLSRLRTKGIDG